MKRTLSTVMASRSSRVLSGPDRCWREARRIVRWLAVCALHRCAEGGQAPGRVRLEVVTVGGAVRGGVGRLDAFGYELQLLRVVTALWDEAESSGPDDPPARVGVVLEALCDPSMPSLFEADPHERAFSGCSIESAIATAPVRCSGGHAVIRGGRTRARRLPTRLSPTWPVCSGSVSLEATGSSVGTSSDAGDEFASLDAARCGVA